MKNLFIYLSGTVKKSHDTDNPSEWTSEHIELMSNLFEIKNYLVHFLNPCTRSDDLSDDLSLFGRDMLQTYLSDFILVDMREKRGIGVGYEVAFANFKNIPVISWCKFGSHYRPETCEILGQKLINFTHPFISQTSKFVAETLEEAVEFIIKYQREDKKLILKSDYTLEAIKHYINAQLNNDKEMYELVSKNDILQKQVNMIKQL